MKELLMGKRAVSIHPETLPWVLLQEWDKSDHNILYFTRLFGYTFDTMDHTILPNSLLQSIGVLAMISLSYQSPSVMYNNLGWRWEVHQIAYVLFWSSGSASLWFKKTLINI